MIIEKILSSKILYSQAILQKSIIVRTTVDLNLAIVWNLSLLEI